MSSMLLRLVVAAALVCWGGLVAFVAQPVARPAPATRLLPASPQLPGPAPAAAAAVSSQATLAASATAFAALAVLAAGRRRYGAWLNGPQTACRALTAEEDLSVEALMKKYEEPIKAIKKPFEKELESFADTYVLRFAIEHKGDVEAAQKNMKEVLAWRSGEGKEIVEKAAAAVAEATAEGGWNNAPVLSAAPHSAIISKYLTPSGIVVVALKDGDICSCIRASAIKDSEMMDAVSVDQLIEFFLYSREVNLLVAEQRTKSSGRLTRFLATNDLTGVSKFPDDRFQKALTGSSKKAALLYPGLSGPTVILNLPGIVRLLVQFLTPLFPGAVQQKLKFARGPMAYLKDLTDVLREPTKSMFIDDLMAVLKA
mmetsp:Transcript_76582/g.224803  ORF Transcript_76582/g.224803 Transcript_76582/m.224803 type:complete len:370 (-) Transcript_76582:117-1226(-)